MPSMSDFAKAIKIGIFLGAFCSMLGMSITYAATGSDQLPNITKEAK